MSGDLTDCCDKQTMIALELPALLERVASMCVSAPGAARVRALRPCPDMATVSRRQRRLSQLRAMLSESQDPSLDGMDDIDILFSRLAVDGAYLTCPELERVAVFLGSVSSAASFLDGAEERFDELFRLRNSFMPMPELAKDIRRIIGPGGSVASSASPELARIRKDMGRARDRLRATMGLLFNETGMAGIFSDQVITQRGDRFVVPVKSEMKSRIAGIIHDTSGTGATCFVEPMEAVEGNNQLALLRRQEGEEEIRILRQVAADLARNLTALYEALEALAKLDCLLAQARFCARTDAEEPRLNNAVEADMLGVRHPLLAWRQAMGRGGAVPVHIHMDDNSRVLIISGANAGGKTVTLKTMGLICLMAMCGLHVTANQGSRVPVFRRVMAEIGDDQDIDRELSTFTAHATRLAWMTGKAGKGVLALIDELGAATDPGEGSALGMAVLDWLRQRGSWALATTHFHRLKAYAAATEGVENVSVSFSETTGMPTYQLNYGSPGFSDAINVSRRLGFPDEVIAAAEANLDTGESHTVALLQDAERVRQQADYHRAEARRDRLRAGEERKEARLFLRQAKEQRAGALAEGKRRVRDVAARLEKRLEQMLEQVPEPGPSEKAVKPGKIKQELYSARRQALDEVEAVVAPPKEPVAAAKADRAVVLKAGAKVRALNLGQTGTLMEDPRPGSDVVAVSVGVAGVRVMVPLDHIESLGGAPDQKPAQPKPSGVSVQVEAGSGLDLKLVGMRVEDALPLVDKAVDQAVVAGRGSINIVHGVGTGALRAAVRDYLRNHPFVAEVRQAGRQQGGAGATVAVLRD